MLFYFKYNQLHIHLLQSYTKSHPNYWQLISSLSIIFHCQFCPTCSILYRKVMWFPENFDFMYIHVRGSPRPAIMILDLGYKMHTYYDMHNTYAYDNQVGQWYALYRELTSVAQRDTPCSYLCSHLYTLWALHGNHARQLIIKMRFRDHFSHTCNRLGLGEVHSCLEDRLNLSMT